MKSLEIIGYKSLSAIKLTNLNPFTAFVGANASGKSNIFEALEFLNFCSFMDPDEAVKYFGGVMEIFPISNNSDQPSIIEFRFDLGDIFPMLRLTHSPRNPITQFNQNRTFNPIVNRDFPVYINSPGHVSEDSVAYGQKAEFNQLLNFTRLFVGNGNLVKRNLTDDSRLNVDASNLEKVLKRIFKISSQKEEVIEILQTLIPGFENIEIKTETFSGTDNLLVWEKGISKPFTKRLISDGTYNLIALIAALFQSDSPQFLCIEEPENGVNPKVARQLVEMFRNFCRDYGHHIWLNTHSQSIVSELTTEEIVLVDKKAGDTQAKQIRGKNLYGLRMDEALLSNSLGGGIPW